MKSKIIQDILDQISPEEHAIMDKRIEEQIEFLNDLNARGYIKPYRFKIFLCWIISTYNENFQYYDRLY